MLVVIMQNYVCIRQEYFEIYWNLITCCAVVSCQDYGQ